VERGVEGEGGEDGGAGGAEEGEGVGEAEGGVGVVADEAIEHDRGGEAEEAEARYDGRGREGEGEEGGGEEGADDENGEERAAAGAGEG
jgi:hypothetical protein